MRPRTIVLTGGPGAGKTAVLDMLRHELCEHVAILPEAAGIVFSGGFPRGTPAVERRAAQRAIYHIQSEVEAVFASRAPSAMLCDRGTMDGAAYWPGPDDFWRALGTTREATMARYDAVIHLRVPDAANGYGHQNPLRTETAEEARRIDDRILQLWEGHPRRVIIDSSTSFTDKVERALKAIGQELPNCCAGGGARRGFSDVKSSDRRPLTVTGERIVLP
jgi:predicted ATPase